MKPRLAVLMPVLLAIMPAYGQTPVAAQSENILVTATRLDNEDNRALGHVTVISAGDIEHSTARTVPELLRARAFWRPKKFQITKRY